MASLHVDQTARYRIKVQGRLDSRWAEWFHAHTFRVIRDPKRGPVTIFTGEVADQAALYGWLSRLRDLGLPLLLVQYLGQSEPPVERDPNAPALLPCDPN